MPVKVNSKKNKNNKKEKNKNIKKDILINADMFIQPPENKWLKILPIQGKYLNEDNERREAFDEGRIKFTSTKHENNPYKIIYY